MLGKVSNNQITDVSSITKPSESGVKEISGKSHFEKNVGKVNRSNIELRISKNVARTATLSVAHNVKNQKETEMVNYPASKFLANGRTLHNTVNGGRHLADNQTAKVMQNLYKEGYDLHSNPKDAVAIEEMLQPMKNAFSLAAAGKLDVLTQPVSLHIIPGESGNNVIAKTSDNLTEQQWLCENDKPGTFLVLNGNNDETYVQHVAKIAGAAENIQFITSGFGGHGTTDRHNIAVNKTEAGRFKDILIENGVSADKIHTDHLSTNSGQNSINVGDILNDLIRDNNACNKIIIAGTPPAVFRQTYTYAKQLNIPAYAKYDAEEKPVMTFSKLPVSGDYSSTPVTGKLNTGSKINESDKQFYIESFPFANKSEYTTTADNLAILREFSTTINYMINTQFLPTDKSLYPEDFLKTAVDSIQTTAQELERDNNLAAKYRTEIAAMKEISPDMIARLKSNSLAESDKDNIKKVDGFFRSLFNPLELTFRRNFM